jgi:hypothetical protein
MYAALITNHISHKLPHVNRRYDDNHMKYELYYEAHFLLQHSLDGAKVSGKRRDE